MKALSDIKDAPGLSESLNLLKGYANQNIDPSEPLVSLVTFGQLIVCPEYARLGLKHAETLLRVRSSVKARLDQAAKLLPPGLTLMVMDAWRSAALQQELYDYYNSNLPPSVDRENYIFNPTTIGSDKHYPTDAPPHRTGGAVDVILGSTRGIPLPMGAVFDEMTPLARTDRFEDEGNISDEKVCFFLQVRRTLMFVMSSAGFSNYPEEYWHFDFGNSFWRHYSKIPGEGRFGVVG